MSPIALTDAQMREIQQAGQLVPYDLRGAFLEQVAAELRGKALGDGIVHRVAYDVARTLDRQCNRDGGRALDHAGDAR